MRVSATAVDHEVPIGPLFPEGLASSGSLVRVPLPIATTNKPERTVRNRTTIVLECYFPGCNHEGHFARKYELRRHMNSKHGGVHSFTCGAVGCFKRGNTRWKFPRLDKLTDHIRAMHLPNTPFAGCPVHDCRFGPHYLDVLSAHIQRAHPRCQLEARAIVTATNAKRRRCPLSGCNNKLLSLDSFLIHLGGHDTEDVRSASSNACFEGLAFEFFTASEIRDAAITSFNISVVCPACSNMSPTFEAFQTHLWSNHLFLDPLQGVEHFFAWRGALTQARGSSFVILPWEKGVMGKGEDVHCTQCMYSVSALHGGPTQHPGLIKSTEQIILELGPFRMQILRLYPDFLTHPIFGDCD